MEVHIFNMSCCAIKSEFILYFVWCHAFTLIHKHTLVFSSLSLCCCCCCCYIITTHKILHKHKQSTPTHTPPLNITCGDTMRSFIAVVFCIQLYIWWGIRKNTTLCLNLSLYGCCCCCNACASHRVLMKSCLKYERCFVQHQPPRTLLYVFENLHMRMYTTCAVIVHPSATPR